MADELASPVAEGLSMQHATVVVDGVELAHISAGEAPVVCLPGWSRAAEQFEPVIERLAADHRVLALDHRGHGRSSQPDHGDRLHRLAADVHGTLEALDLDRVCLLGHSIGVDVIWVTSSSSEPNASIASCSPTTDAAARSHLERRGRARTG